MKRWGSGVGTDNLTIDGLLKGSRVVGGLARGQEGGAP